MRRVHDHAHALMCLRQRSLQISMMMEKIIFSGKISSFSISMMDMSNGHTWVKFAVCGRTGMFLQAPPHTASLIPPPCCREQSTRIWQTAHLAPSSVTFRNEAPCLVALDYANISLLLIMPTSDPNHRVKQNSTLNCCCLFFRRKCLSGM